MSASRVAEILKCCRADWISRPEIHRATGFDRTTVERAVRELLEAGLLVEQEHHPWKQLIAEYRSSDKVAMLKNGDKRRRCRRFRLSAEWGGKE